jgi:hypothetical protein
MKTTTKLNQDAEPSAIAPVRVQPVVQCAWSTDDGPCREPATVEAYSTASRRWYALCPTHKVNIIAPLRKISQLESTLND